MKKIIVPNPKNDTLIAQLASVYFTFRNTAPQEQIEFDLRGVRWCCPLLVLPLSAYIARAKSTCLMMADRGYLETIHFPAGIDSVTEFDQFVQATKNYIPISVLKRNKGTDREKLEAQFSLLVYKILGSVPNAQNAVHYPITELVTNIFDHSQEENGFIFAQFYPKKNYLDVCIVDCGRGLAQTYKEEKQIDLSDEESIIRVLEGHSTKESKERGYGVRTSKGVVCGALGGDFIMVSGSSALVASGGKEKLVSLPEFYWQGVIIAYRIPRPAGPVDISPYLE